MLTWTETYYISEWVIRLIMLVYVPQRRSPAAARTWLLLIFFLPWPGLILYGLIGRISLPPKRIQLRAQAAHLLRTSMKEYMERKPVTQPDLGPRLMQAVTLASHLGDFNIRGGNTVELLAEYAGSIDRLVADIDAAQDHVHLLYYIFANDATGGRVADALVRAAGRGVKCRVLMDGLASRRSARALTPRLRAAGVDVRLLLPIGFLRQTRTRLDLRNHRKIAVVDGRTGYVGSQNLVDPTFKKGIVYEELVARVTGPVVWQLQAVFLADHFVETGIAESDLASFFPETIPGGESPAQALPSAPGFEYENTQRLIVALIHGARERVVITTPYFVPDEPLLEAMQTAVLRGVEVHLILSRQADQMMVCLAQRSYYEELLEAGVHIHLYRPFFLHAKHLSIDDSIALIGSSNMDIRSFALNAEISLLIYDPHVVARQRKIQERYFADADLLTLEEWRRRPRLAKITQNIARLVDALL